MTHSEKNEIQKMINDAVQTGIIEAIKTIYSDKEKLIDLIEDIGLANAINECNPDEIATREELFSILEK